MNLDKAIQRRKSVRSFSNKEPNWRKIIEAIDAARHAPMAGNNYSLRFILVDDKKQIQRIAEATQQDFCKEVNYIVVVYTNPKRTINAYGEKRGIRYCRQQAGAAIQNFLLKLTGLGLDTCWVGHFYDEMIKEVLGVPEDCLIEAVFPIGYELNKTKQPPKIDIDRILFFNKYNNKKMWKPKKLDT